MKLNKDDRIRIGIIIGISILVLFYIFSIGDKEITTVGGNWNISDEVKGQDYEQFLVEEPDFDYTDPIIFNLAKQIKQSTSNPEDAIKKTIKHVATEVKYTVVDIDVCYLETASSVAENKVGDCVSMSRLVTSLLRAQGIPARTAGGCLTSFRCDILFSAVPSLEIQTTSMVEGDFKKRGFLHEWVEAWTPERGWMVIEATAGRLYSTDCDTYTYYGYDSNNRNRCVINDLSFWNQCKIS